MHLVVVTLCPGHGETLVPAQLSSFLLGLLVCDVECVCLLVYTWCHAAWGQGRCIKSFPFASLLRARCRGGSRNIAWECGSNA